MGAYFGCYFFGARNTLNSEPRIAQRQYPLRRDLATGEEENHAVLQNLLGPVIRFGDEGLGFRAYKRALGCRALWIRDLGFRGAGLCQLTLNPKPLDIDEAPIRALCVSSFHSPSPSGEIPQEFELYGGFRV